MDKILSAALLMLLFSLSFAGSNGQGAEASSPLSGGELSAQELQIKEELERGNRALYAQALRYWADGDRSQAMEALRVLLERGVKSPSISVTLLDFSRAMLEREGPSASPQTQKEAVRYAQNAVREFPTSPRVLRAASDILRVAGRYHEFHDVLEKMIGLEPTSIYANYFSGLYYFMNRDYDSAAPRFENVTRNNIADGQFEQMALYNSRYYLGMIRVFGGKLKDAVSEFDHAREIVPDNPELNRTLGLVLAEILETDRALSILTALPASMKSDEVVSAIAALRLWNGDTNSPVTEGDFLPLPLAIAAWKSGNFDKAVEYARKAFDTKSGPEIPIRYLLYLCYRKLGKTPEAVEEAFLIGKRAREIGNATLALEYFRKVQNERKDLPEIHWLIGSICDETGDRKGAIENYNRFKASVQNSEYLVPACIRLSWLYGREGKPAESAAALEEAAKKATLPEEHFQVLSYTAVREMENHHYREAVVLFREAQKYRKDDAQTRYLLATCLEEAGERTEALDILEQLVLNHPDSADANNLLAYLYALEKKELGRAVELVERALVKNPDNIAYLDTLGWIYYQKNDFSNSLSVFTRVLFEIDRTAPDPQGLEEIYYHIGMLYERLDRGEEAKRYYRMGAKLAPESNYFRGKKIDTETGRTE